MEKVELNFNILSEEVPLGFFSTCNNCWLSPFSGFHLYCSVWISGKAFHHLLLCKLCPMVSCQNSTWPLIILRYPFAVTYYYVLECVITADALWSDNIIIHFLVPVLLKVTKCDKKNISYKVIADVVGMLHFSCWTRWDWVFKHNLPLGVIVFYRP